MSDASGKKKGFTNPYSGKASVSAETAQKVDAVGNSGISLSKNSRKKRESDAARMDIERVSVEATPGKPAVVESTAVKPVVAEPAAGKPAVVEPTAVKPVVAEPAAVKSAAAEPTMSTAPEYDMPDERSFYTAPAPIGATVVKADNTRVAPSRAYVPSPAAAPRVAEPSPAAAPRAAAPSPAAAPRAEEPSPAAAPRAAAPELASAEGSRETAMIQNLEKVLAAVIAGACVVTVVSFLMPFVTVDWFFSKTSYNAFEVMQETGATAIILCFLTSLLGVLPGFYSYHDPRAAKATIGTSAAAIIIMLIVAYSDASYVRLVDLADVGYRLYMIGHFVIIIASVIYVVISSAKKE